MKVEGVEIKIKTEIKTEDVEIPNCNSAGVEAVLNLPSPNTPGSLHEQKTFLQGIAAQKQVDKQSVTSQGMRINHVNCT